MSTQRQQTTKDWRARVVTLSATKGLGMSCFTPLLKNPLPTLSLDSGFRRNDEGTTPIISPKRSQTVAWMKRSVIQERTRSGARIPDSTPFHLGYSYRKYTRILRFNLVYLLLSFAFLASTQPGVSVAASPDISSREMSMDESEAPLPQTSIRLSPAQRQMIGVTSAVVEQAPLKKTIHAVGRIDFDERRLVDVTFKVGGWIQDLFVDYTGRRVRKGEPLLTLYSPDLVASQEEYLLALRTRDQLAQSSLPEARIGSQGLVEAARRRLLLWDLTLPQLKALEERGAPQTYLTLSAPASGVVVEKMAVKGMRVEPGMKLYRIADLSTVWLYADVYEYEVPLVREGQEVAISLSYYPGETFHGKIIYIYPYLDTQTRTNKIRLEFANPQGKLKPGMYANSEIEINLGSALTIPESAVLQSGLRQLVFVEQSPGVFTPREVKLGVKADSRFAVLDGLTAGERVVTSGNFLLDSESKLQAATSMMGMMGAIGMGDWKMESARPMEMGTQTAQAKPMEKKVGSLAVTVSTVPDAAALGENTLRVQIKESTGKPITDAIVSLEYTMDMPGMLIDKAEAKHVGDGMYEAPVRFTMAGPWGVTVSIRRSGQAELRERFTVGVGQ